MNIGLSIMWCSVGSLITASTLGAMKEVRTEALATATVAALVLWLLGLIVNQVEKP